MKTSDLKSAPNSRHSIMHCIVKACRKGHATAAAAAAGVRKAINTKYPHCDVINDEQWNESGAKFKKRNNSQPYEYLILVLLMNAWNCVPLTRNTLWNRNDYYIRDKWVLTTLVFSLNKHRKTNDAVLHVRCILGLSTAPLTPKFCILYIYLTNIGTEYFKHRIYSPFFLFKMKFVS